MLLNDAERVPPVVRAGQVIVLSEPAPAWRFPKLLEHAVAAAGLPPGEPFALFLAMNYSADRLDPVSVLAEDCLRHGMFSIDVWGEGCEMVHDIVDETEIALQLSDPGASAGTVMTNWHDEKQVDDALWTFVSLASASDGRREGRLWLVLLDEDVDCLPLETWFATSGLGVRRLSVDR